MLYPTQLTGMVLLALLNGAQSYNCSDLVLDPPELVVRYGDPVSVSCRSLSNDTDLDWTVPVSDIFNPDAQTVTWETENLTDWEIQPVCYKNQTDVQCSRMLPLTVYKLPDQVSISVMNHSGPMTEGREYNLKCDIHTVAPIHLLNVAWYKGLRMVNNRSFNDKLNKSPETISTMLRISPSRDDDGVQYRCEAMLNLGQEFQDSHTVTSDPLNITITSKPKNCSDLVLDPPELVVRYGDPVSVSCRSLSSDTDLVWSVPTGNVFKPDTQSITWETDNLTDWEIQPVCYKNRTDVQCERALQIIVYKIPEKVSISFMNHIGPMTAGKKYELQCDIENFAPVHVLAVFWYKGDQLLKNRGFSDLPTKTPSNKTVTLKVMANRTDSDAPFRCEAKLKLGEAGPQPPPIVTSNLLSTEVNYKPVITCSDWSALVNTTLSSYPYNVMGKPSPNITCYRDQSPVSSDMRLTRSDTGQYRFTAFNEVGSSSCDTKITVEYPPTFTCPDTYTGKEYESFLDKCSVMASPVAKITWTKDGKTVSPIHSLTKGDDGLYVITAVNKHGAERHSLTIKVLDGCEITIQPAKLVVEFGASATANCSTTVTHNGMGWEAVNGAVDITKGVQFLTWRVESLKYWDIQPICYVNAHEQCESELPVTLYKRPEKVSISTVDHTGPMIEGKLYKLDCDVKNVAPVNLLTVNWYKGQPGQLVKSVQFNNTSSKTPVNRSTELSISTSKEDDGVQYRCEAKLELGPEGPQPPPIKTSDPLNIIVHYKPVITCSDWSALVNTTLSSYPYNVMGKPSPNITCYRDQSPVSSDMRLSRSDTGQYRFTASNEVGSSSCDTKITVEYPPTFNCPDTYTGKENESFLDKCSVMASPVAKITWTKDGKTVSPLHSLTRGDSGSYVITAVNKHGVEPHRMIVNVQYGPEIQPVTRSEVVKAGNDLSLSCTAEGNPEPEVSWSFQNQTKATGRRQTILNLSKANSADAGEYLCTASNELGSKTRTVSLTVEESNMRTIIICVGVLLLILILIIYVIYTYVVHKRSGRYTIQTNGDVSMSLLK
ncbi:hypothetical protein Q7C36_014126 [Tachysurus vachellii]|uniref:Ig-like domain-containing protein n=1 Tax=Tachysurus vachellii TaxID=175792 RepID=A0AA88ME45_TACVA|nr:hypothetical protein Q7C36_014126 [Tachysurus vachellii]